MRKSFVLMLLLFLFVVTSPSTTFAYNGGLIEGQVPNSSGMSTVDATRLTDNNLSTFGAITDGGGYAQFTLPSVTTIHQVYINTNFVGDGFFVQFFDASNVLLGSYKLDTTVGDASRIIYRSMYTFPTPISGVKKVKLLNSGSTFTVSVYEFDVYTNVPTPVPSPKAVDISLVRGGNTIVPKMTIINYDSPKKVSTSDLLPYSYNNASKM